MEFSEVEKDVKLSLNDQLNMYFKHDAAAKIANITFGCIKTFTTLLKFYINFGVHILESSSKFVCLFVCFNSKD